MFDENLRRQIDIVQAYEEPGKIPQNLSIMEKSGSAQRLDLYRQSSYQKFQH